MKRLVYILLHLIPHFRTVYYLKWQQSDGQMFNQVLYSPLDIPADQRHYIHCMSSFVLGGKPLFARYHAYLPEKEES